ncbi:MAG: glycosyltransferase, partial [Actinobacteria bacterium]|nr:glycosyltransferase [Actinomycetota bacterium]
MIRAGEPRVSVVVTAYEEGDAILPHLDRIFEAVRLPCEVLVVCDSPDDSTMPCIEKYARSEP